MSTYNAAEISEAVLRTQDDLRTLALALAEAGHHAWALRLMAFEAIVLFDVAPLLQASLH